VVLVRFVGDGANAVRSQVGQGNLRGRLIVDQPYAQVQHEDVSLHHPRGGQAKFLETPLLAEATRYVQHLADHVISGDPEKAMQDNVEDLSGQVQKHAPVDSGRLRESGHPIVVSNRSTVYDRPPVQARET
jgi:hypothetical protein